MPITPFKCSFGNTKKSAPIVKPARYFFPESDGVLVSVVNSSICSVFFGIFEKERLTIKPAFMLILSLNAVSLCVCDFTLKQNNKLAAKIILIYKFQFKNVLSETDI